jgi:Spy/CpxP family protein refolding chaperone
MKKIALLAVIAAVAMSMSAQAETVRHKQRVASKEKQCWLPTDTLGHGYWQGCDTLTPAQLDQMKRGSPGGFDGGGGGGGGGGR